MENCENVALTSDLWTSRCIRSYLTITVHFITETWEYKSHVLQTREFEKAHTTQNLYEVFQQVFLFNNYLIFI